MRSLAGLKPRAGTTASEQSAAWRWLVRGRDLLLQVFDGVLGLLVPAARPGRRVLLIRTDEIGDYVVHRQALLDLQAYFVSRGQQVDFLCLGLLSSLAQADQLGEQVLILDKRRYSNDWRYRARLFVQLRRAGYGAVVQTRQDKIATVEDALTFAVHAPLRIGWEGSPVSLYGLLSRPLYHLSFTRPAVRQVSDVGRPQRHEFDFSRVLSAFAGASHPAVLRPSAATPVPELHVPTRYAVVFPTAGWPGREWPAPRFAQIAERLWARHGLDVVLCAAGPLPHLAGPLRAALGSHLSDLSGQTSVPQLAQIIAGAEIVITNETSAAHFAASNAVPCVTVLGGGHFGRFMPYPLDAQEARLSRAVYHSMPCFQCDWACQFPREPDAPVRCIDRIDVETVWQTVEAALIDGGDARD